MPKRISVKVHVKSSKPRVEVESGYSLLDGRDVDTYHVFVSSPPEGGKANKEVIQLLSEFLNTSKSNIQIIKGFNSRSKLIDIL